MMGSRWFFWSAAGAFRVWQTAVEANDKLQLLIENPAMLWLSSWSRDGPFLAAVQDNADTGADIVVWDMKEQELIQFLNSSSNERFPEFSPDGRCLAYTSNETGRMEVYLRSFPNRNRKIPVSNQEGYAPAWSADGHELFYASPVPSKMMKVDINLGTSPTIGLPKPLFDFQFLMCTPMRGYDLYPDGRRFVFPRIKERAIPADITRIKFVQNWFEELKRLCPTGKN